MKPTYIHSSSPQRGISETCRLDIHFCFSCSHHMSGHPCNGMLGASSLSAWKTLCIPHSWSLHNAALNIQIWTMNLLHMLYKIFLPDALSLHTSHNSVNLNPLPAPSLKLERSKAPTESKLEDSKSSSTSQIMFSCVLWMCCQYQCCRPTNS